MGAFQGGIIPSRRQHWWNAARASSSVTEVLDAADVMQPGVFRADAG
jgi:hypothetical protein